MYLLCIYNVSVLIIFKKCIYNVNKVYFIFIKFFVDNISNIFVDHCTYYAINHYMMINILKYFKYLHLDL